MQYLIDQFADTIKAAGGADVPLLIRGAAQDFYVIALPSVPVRPFLRLRSLDAPLRRYSRLRAPDLVTARAGRDFDLELKPGTANAAFRTTHFGAGARLAVVSNGFPPSRRMPAR